ncbi:hypothetical protein [Nonomuraea sp. NPDC003804]|uniref:hypothetical protein n=1 Tax=Nonomuraea sp. NPDC003804 TaxID=3154547 RepID=UPI0033A79448
MVQPPVGNRLTVRAVAGAFLDTLPPLLKGRTRAPVFVTHRRPGRGKVVTLAAALPPVSG